MWTYQTWLASGLVINGLGISRTHPGNARFWSSESCALVLCKSAPGRWASVVHRTSAGVFKLVPAEMTKAIAFGVMPMAISMSLVKATEACMETPTLASMTFLSCSWPVTGPISGPSRKEMRRRNSWIPVMWMLRAVCFWQVTRTAGWMATQTLAVPIFMPWRSMVLCHGNGPFKSEAPAMMLHVQCRWMLLVMSSWLGRPWEDWMAFRMLVAGICLSSSWTHQEFCSGLIRQEPAATMKWVGFRLLLQVIFSLQGTLREGSAAWQMRDSR